MSVTDRFLLRLTCGHDIATDDGTEESCYCPGCGLWWRVNEVNAFRDEEAYFPAGGNFHPDTQIPVMDESAQ